MISFILTVTDTEKRNVLEELYNTHGKRMYGSAYKILGNRQDAEDALQETFIKIYKNIESFIPLSGDELILLIIIYTRNTARDILRKRNRETEHTAQIYTEDDGSIMYPDIADPSADVEEIVINKELIQRTAAYIDELPEPQREVIIMKYRLGMKEKEIASALGISETAVSSRVLRAKEGMRKKLSE